MTNNLTEELQRTARLAMTGLHPVAQGQEPGGLPFRRLLAAAFRARFLLFGTTLFGVLIGAFLAITTPNTYVSTGKFLFTASGAEATRVDLSRSTEMSQESIGSTAPYVLNTDDLFQRVVTRVTPSHILEPYQPGNVGDSGFRSWFFRVQRDWNATKAEDRTPEGALRHLQKTLVITRERNTDVLIATCSANSQNLAQDILKTYMEEAIKWHIEMYDDPKVYEKLKSNKEEAESRRSTANRQMRDFLDLKAYVQDFSIELLRFKKDDSDAAAVRRSLQLELDVKRAQVQKYVEVLADKETLPQYKTELLKPDTSLLEISYTEQITKLELELARKRAVGTLNVEGDEKTIQHAKASLAQLKKEANEAPLESRQIENPEWRESTKTLSDLRRDIVLKSTELQQLTERQQPFAEQLQKMVALEAEFLSLRDAQISADELLTTARESWNKAQDKKLLGQGNFSSLNKISSASFPLEKESPNRGKLLMGGFFVGLFLGLGIVVLRTLPDTLVRTREDLEHLEGLSVIGLMPRLDGTNLRRHISLREQGW
ncbi:MAG: hypothetical protein ABIP94_07550 [Planctomycetota bacterium]